MVSLFALPAMADMVVDAPASGFLSGGGGYNNISGDYETLYSYIVPANCTATFVGFFYFIRHHISMQK